MNKILKINNSKNQTIFIGIFIVLLTLMGNINLYSQYERNVVFEEFTEVWCGPCATTEPAIIAWLNENPDYISIFYVSYFNINGQKKYHANAEYTVRKNFHKVPFYPFATINAEKVPNTNYPGFPTNVSKFKEIIDTMTKTTPVKIVIDFTNNGATGNVKVDITSDVALVNKNMYVMLVEKHHEFERQPNGMTNYHNIMRKMLPNGNGEQFSISAGETLTFEYDYSLTDDINYDMYATVLVQDNNTKYIYQAETMFKADPTSVIDNNDSANDITIIPNPVSSNINLKLNSDDEFINTIEIFNSVGYKVNTINIENRNELRIGSKDFSGKPLSNGVYYLKIQTNKSVSTKKIIILR